MKATLVIICLISAVFAVDRAIRIFGLFNKDLHRPIWETVGASILAFILGAIIWPVLCCVWGWEWIKKHPILKITIEGLVIMAIGAVMIYFGFLLS